MGIGGASFSLVLTDSAAFKARLAWLKLRHLHLLSGRESVPRIACVSLPSARAFVSFPASVNAGGPRNDLADAPMADIDAGS